MTLEFIDGIKVSDLEKLERAGLDRRLIGRRGADAFIKMVLEHGFFHGDPHPGNVLILPENVICLLDYGMVGRLDAELQEYLIDILLAIVKRNVDDVISLLLYSGEITDSLNIKALKRDLSEFIDDYYEVPLQDIEVGRMLMEFLEIMTTYRIRFQPDLMLLAKALVAIEGMGRKLDPQFDMVAHLRPFMEKADQETDISTKCAERDEQPVHVIRESHEEPPQRPQRDIEQPEPEQIQDRSGTPRT